MILFCFYFFFFSSIFRFPLLSPTFYVRQINLKLSYNKNNNNNNLGSAHCTLFIISH